MRTILHVDLDAFYSSIEQRDNPDLRGKPVVVGGDPASRGVVMTASYEARKFGVHSAMPMRTAVRLCPQAIIVHPRFDAYTTASRQLHDIFRRLTPLIEPIALDEAYLDLSDQFPSPLHAESEARALKQRILVATSLTASLGLGTSKLVAKIASDANKPDGLTVVEPGTERAFLAPLKIRRLQGVGPKSEQRLQQAGIETVGQLADARSEWVTSRLGQIGLEWQRLAQGIDERPVCANRELKQISRERTFAHDVSDRAKLLEVLQHLIEEISPAMEHSRPARTVNLKLRYFDFTTITRRRTPGGVLTPEALTSAARGLLAESWNGRPVRLVGLGISNFVKESADQPSLF